MHKFPVVAVASAVVASLLITLVVATTIIVKRCKHRQKMWNDSVVVYRFGSQEALQNRNTNGKFVSGSFWYFDNDRQFSTKLRFVKTYFQCLQLNKEKLDAVK